MSAATERQKYRRNNLLYGAFLLLLMGAVYIYRNTVQRSAVPSEPPPENEALVQFRGQTMGTVPYQVKYLDQEKRHFKAACDSLLRVFNQSLSTYIPDSEISRFNHQQDTLLFELPYFYPVLLTSRKVWEKTEGAFDPTVFPLVNAWGFGPGQKESPTAATLDSLRQLVNFPAVQFDEQQVWRTQPNLQLDFSAIAKGQAVDVIGAFLEEQGVRDYLVEIGGEVRCRGKNPENEVWRIGIEDPVAAGEGKIRPLARVLLQDKSMATSGNYRNFYMKDGKRYVHTISPQTGYPVEHDLLSVSVLAPDCMQADAFATAFMVIGRQEAKRILEQEPELEAFFIYDDNGKLATEYTAGLSRLVSLLEEKTD